MDPCIPEQHMERRCFIHIGTHKTGTTSIQAFLAENRAALLARGVLIPYSAGNADPAFAAHHGLVRYLSGLPGEHFGGLDALGAELAASKAANSCITSENISLLYDRPAALHRLRDTIEGSGFTPVVVAYVRPQVSYSVAIYAANVVAGYRAPFRQFLADVLGRGCYVWDGGLGPPFDYVELLDAFAGIFGRDRLVVRRFTSDAPDRALLRSFMNIVLPRDADLAPFTIPAKRANRTSTFAAVLRLLDEPNDFDEHIRFAPLGLGDIRRCWTRFAPSNRRLFARYGVRLPVFDALDLFRALPLRRTLTRTRQLRAGRRALNACRRPNVEGNA